VWVVYVVFEWLVVCGVDVVFGVLVDLELCLCELGVDDV